MVNNKNRSDEFETDPPKRRGLVASADVPDNIEKLLIEASMDESLFSALLTNRKKTLNEITFPLTPIEKQMFLAIPESALITMIHRMSPRPTANCKFATSIRTRGIMRGWLKTSFDSTHYSLANREPLPSLDPDTDNEY